MATRILTGYNSGNSGNIKGGATFSYSSSTTDTGAVYNSTPKSARITVPVKYCDTSQSFYFNIYVGGVKVAETVELWSKYDDTLVGATPATVTETFELEYLEDEILTASGSIKFELIANSNNNVYCINLRNGTATLEVEYGSSATLGNPGTPTIKENYNGTYTASWTAASASGGSGSVYYQWRDARNGGYWSNWSTSNSVTLNIPGYDVEYAFQVRASYDGASSSSAGALESWSPVIYKTFTQPTVTKPGAPTITQNSDGTFKASWTASTGNYGVGSVSYQLYCGNDLIGSATTNTSITANIPTYGTAYSFTVKATYSGVSATSNATSYTFAQPTLGKPGKPTITSTTTQYTVTWNAASAANGTGSVYYRVIIAKTDGSYVNTTNWQTSRTYTANIPSSGVYAITIEATYHNASSSSAGALSSLSDTTEVTLTVGSLTAPGAPTITQNYDGTFTASWTAATGSGSSGSIYYMLYNVTTSEYVTNRITDTRVTLNVPGYGTTYTYRVFATYGGASASINGAFTANSANTSVTFLAATLSTPDAPTIVQNTNGTFTASWGAAVGNYGVGDVYYQLWNATSNTAVSNRITTTSTTHNIPNYNSEITYTVKATYNGATGSADGALVKTSEGTKKTFTKPSLIAPTLSLSTYSGSSASLSWSAAQLVNATGVISYTIYGGTTALKTVTTTSATIEESVLAPLGTVVLSVQATATDLSNTASGATITATSNTVSFTYSGNFSGASNLAVSGTNTAVLTWTKGSSSYGDFVYDIYAGNNVIVDNLSSTTTTYTLSENIVCGWSNMIIRIKTRNTTSNQEVFSNQVTFTYSPKYTAPSGLKTNGSGSQAIVSWTAGTTTYGTMVYEVYANNTKVGDNITTNSFTILESVLEGLNNKTVSIYIKYKVLETGVTDQLSAVTFTYVPSVTKHTVGYRQGGRNHNCLVYVCVNGAWVKCVPYVYANGKWNICSTK